MIFIVVHIIVCAITLWLFLNRHQYGRGEIGGVAVTLILIHVLLLSIYFWYFHVHDDGYRFYRWIGKMMGIYNEYNM